MRSTLSPLENGEYPEEVLQGLKDMGSSASRSTRRRRPRLHQAEYCKLVELIGAYDSNLVALISAHNSIVPQPLIKFGSEELKVLAHTAGAIQPRATEPDVGPTRSPATTVKKNEDGTYTNGLKLWITNGTIADYIVVMARDIDSQKISAFVVDMFGPASRSTTAAIMA